jgi:hypothetical protein
VIGYVVARFVATDRGAPSLQISQRIDVTCGERETPSMFCAMRTAAHAE